MDEAEHFRDIAELCRREAERMPTQEAKDGLSDLATDFEHRAIEADRSR